MLFISTLENYKAEKHDPGNFPWTLPKVQISD
jgi:hypothetical protein